jgi:transcriptional regulator with XRE-family HTH domain
MEQEPDIPQSATVAIGEAAVRIGVSRSTLRAWEAIGLSRPERDHRGHRRYSETEIARLHTLKSWPRNGRRSQWRVAREAHQAQGDLKIARQLRSLRSRLRMTVREAAERSTLSPSYISALENGVAHPSVAALQKLARSYGVTILDFYQSNGDKRRRLTRAGCAEWLHMGSPELGVALLTPHDSQIELHLFELQPGASSGGEYCHEGDEFWYVLRGVLGVWLNGEFYRLEAGDCLSFASTDQHRFENLAESVTAFLGANTPSTF